MTVDLRAQPVEILDVTPQHPSGRVRSGRSARIELLAGVAAAGAFALGTTAPVGIALADGLYRAVFAAALVWFGARARRATWGFLIIGAAIGAATLLAQLFTVAALAIFGRSLHSRRRTALTGASIAALCLPALFTQGAGPFWRLTSGVIGDPFGTSAVLAAVATAPIFRTGWRSISRRRRRSIRQRARRVGLGALAVIAASGIVCLAALPTMLNGLHLTQVAADDATNGNLERATQGLEDAHERWSRANRLVSGPWMLPARLLPIAGQNVRAAQVVTGQASALTDAAAEVTDRVRPDELVVDGALNIDEVDAITPAMDAFAATADRAADRISAVNGPWLIPPINERVARAEEVLVPASGMIGASAEGLHVARDLLGGDDQSHVLVALTTPSEARGAGGFVGSWVVLVAEDGRVAVEDHYRSKALNDLLEENNAELHADEDYLNRYGRFSIERHMQDVTISPDFPSVAAVAADLFEQATGQNIDAVVQLDPFVLQQLLAFSGPIDTGDFTLTGANAANELLVEQYSRYAEDEEGREAALQVMADTLAGRLLESPPDPIAFAMELAPLADQNRINLWLAGDDGSTTRRLGLAGEFEIGEQDTFAVVHQNAGQNKIDSFLERTIDLESVLDVEAQIIDHYVTITLDNSATTDRLPDAIVASNDQGLVRGTNRMTLSTYSNHPLRSARLNGEPVPIESDTEFGLAVYSLVLDLEPGEFATLDMHFHGALAEDSTYGMHLGAQPLVDADLVRWHVRTLDGTRIDPPDGWTTHRDGARWSGVLDRDTDFSFDIGG